MGSTDEEIFDIEEKARDNKEKEVEEEYEENNDDRDNESSDSEEEDSEEENSDETASGNTLCCVRDLCKQQEGCIIIGKGHKCVVCEGRMHGLRCSDEKVDDMVGMTCKKCALRLSRNAKRSTRNNHDGNNIINDPVLCFVMAGTSIRGEQVATITDQNALSLLKKDGNLL